MVLRQIRENNYQKIAIQKNEFSQRFWKNSVYSLVIEV